MSQDEVRVFRDGDVIVSADGIIFYAFGYSHPANRVIAYPKYIPARLKNMFELPWIPDTVWRFSGEKVYRPKELFSADIYGNEIFTFMMKLPEYIYHCPYLGKLLIAVPRRMIRRTYVPCEGLKRLLNKRGKDELEEKAISLIMLLSEESSVDLEDFGIHGSILLGMHRPGSDIDVAVYGAENFLKVMRAIEKLERDGTIRLVFENETDPYRRNKGEFLGTKFVVNAVRKYEEIREEYGTQICRAVKPVEFVCKISDAREAMFRPAVYRLSWCRTTPSTEVPPRELVSMIGAYRGFAKEGDVVQGVGFLEWVYNSETGDEWWRIVVGSGYQREYICHVKS